MSSAVEQRILRLESLIQPLRREIKQLRDQLATLRQQQHALDGQEPGGGGGGGGVFFADHLSIAAASGLLSGPPTIHSTTGDVYRINGGAMVLADSGATIWNGMPDATDAGKRQELARNNDGSYTVTGQSCTSP